MEKSSSTHIHHFDVHHLSRKVTQEGLNSPGQLLWKVCIWNIMPRTGDHGCVRNFEVPILYALATGHRAISYAHLVMLNIWEAYESKERKIIPHVWLISQFLKLKGAVPSDSDPKIISEHDQYIRKSNFRGLVFEHKRDGFYILDKETREEHKRDHTEAEVQAWDEAHRGVSQPDQRVVITDIEHEDNDGNVEGNLDTLFEQVYRPVIDFEQEISSVTHQDALSGVSLSSEQMNVSRTPSQMISFQHASGSIGQATEN